MAMSRKVKFIPCRLLLHILNEESRKLNFNKNITPEASKEIDEASYPITEAFLHDDDSVRCRIIINNKGDIVYIDIPVERYNNLPNMVI